MMEVRDGLYIVHVTDNKVDFLRFIPAQDTIKVNTENNLEKVFIDIAKEREENNYG